MEPPPLAGLRVLDLSRVLAGPYCTMLLADLGAEVIKVEQPGGGDPSRSWGPPFVAGESTYFLSVNRGKRSIVIDLSNPAGREVALRLADGADVVVENFLPGGAERLGLDRTALARRRPGQVLCSIRGYPEESEDAARPGFDFAVQGDAGLMSITGEPDGPPLKVGVAVTDLTTGMLACSGILAALLQARLSGRGRHVVVSLWDAQVAWLANRGAEALIAGQDPTRLGNDHPSICPYATFATRDGHVNLAVGTDEQFRRLCAALDLPAVAVDARFRTNADRVRSRSTLMPLLGERLIEDTTDRWLDRVRAARVPGGPVRTVRQVVDEAPWATVRHAHPTVGELRSFRSPITVDGVRHTASAAPPLLGADGADLLREAGYSSDQAEALLRGPCAARATDRPS